MLIMRDRNIEELLNDVEVFKFTRKDKENDDRAIETVKRFLSKDILKKLTLQKIHESDIEILSVKHCYRGIWKIELKRATEYEHKTQHEHTFMDENINKVKVGSNDILDVIDGVVKFDLIEMGYDEQKFEFLSEVPRDTIDKKKESYLSKHESRSYAKLFERKSRWNDQTENELKEQLFGKEFLNLAIQRLYAKPYDDRNDKDYSITQDQVEHKFQLYLIPVIRVHYRLKEKIDWLDVDAITREIMKNVKFDRVLNLNEETKELLLEAGADVAGATLPGSSPFLRVGLRKLLSR